MFCLVHVAVPCLGFFQLCTHFCMKKATLLLAAVLAACGGGGDNNTSPGPAPAPAPSPAPPAPSPTPAPIPSPGLTPVTPDGIPAPATFTPALLEMEALEGDSVSSSVGLRYNIATDEALSVRVEVPPLFNPILGVGRSSDRYSELAQATLTLSKSAPSGIHTGTIKVQLCRDLPQDCNRPYLSSPWVLPYKITVHSIGPRLTELRPLNGQSQGWTQGYGNASSSSSVDTTEVFDPSKFSVRWHIRPVSPTTMDPNVVAAGGLVALQKGPINEVGRTLEAVSEASGKLVWQRPISSYSRGTVMAQGRIFLLESVNPSLSQLNGYAPADGARVLSKDTTYRGDLQLITDGQSIYGRSPILRWDAITGNLVWREAPSERSIAPNRLVRSGSYLYAYDGSGVQRFDIATGERALLTPSTAVSAGGHMVVADQRNNLFTTFNAGGWVSVRRFSTESSAQVWQRDLTNGSTFSASLYSMDMPAVDAHTLYLVTSAGPYGKQPVIWALSTSDGADKWSRALPGLAENIRLVAAGNLLFVSSYSAEATRTVALDKNTGEIVWSVPVAGSLALSENGTLYIAKAAYHNEGGSLTGINLR